MTGAPGFVVFDTDARVARWAGAAYRVGRRVAQDGAMRARNLRHGDTWFVGVDALPNDARGAIDGVPLAGPWDAQVPDLPQHRAQLSIIYPGYPARDADQSTANHRYRVDRCAAHVDGLLSEGPGRRRFAREFHAYILGIPLNDVAQAPTVVWPGSHRIMQAALREAIRACPAHDTTRARAMRDVDVTDAYHAARRQVFKTCDPVALRARPGQAFLIHRLALHGTAPWGAPKDGPGDELQNKGRMIAFLRPEFSDPREWLAL